MIEETASGITRRDSSWIWLEIRLGEDCLGTPYSPAAAVGLLTTPSATSRQLPICSFRRPPATDIDDFDTSGGVFDERDRVARGVKSLQG